MKNVIQADGTLIKLERKKAKKRARGTDDEKTFIKCFYAGTHKDLTLKQVAWNFKRHTGKWPTKNTVGFCPSSGSKKWKMKTSELRSEMQWWRSQL